MLKSERGSLAALVHTFGLVLCLASTFGCAGPLPGVRDCETLSLRVALVKSPADLHLVGKKQQIYELTTECLTLPYDVAMFACIESGEDPIACRQELAARVRHREQSFRLGEFFARWKTFGR